MRNNNEGDDANTALWPGARVVHGSKRECIPHARDPLSRRVHPQYGLIPPSIEHWKEQKIAIDFQECWSSSAMAHATTLQIAITVEGTN